MPSGRDRLARLLIDLRTPAPTEGEVAVITAINAGAGTDGNALVTVNHNGSMQQYPYALHYTPVVGHVVAIGRWGGKWMILGRPGGFPPNS